MAVIDPDLPDINAVRAARQSAVGSFVESESWLNVTLINSWVTIAGQQVPQYRKLGDLVFLRGVCRSGSDAAFSLPVGFRPPVSLTFAVGSSGTPGTMQVGSNGDVTLISGASTAFHLNGVVCTSLRHRS